MSHFVVPKKFYFVTFAALLVLTFLTVFLAQFHFGALNLPIAMLVASAKASLVLLIFMGLKWEKGFSWVLLISAFLFLLVFVMLTFGDIAYRGYNDPIETEKINLNSPVRIIDSTDSGHGSKEISEVDSHH